MKNTLFLAMIAALFIGCPHKDPPSKRPETRYIRSYKLGDPPPTLVPWKTAGREDGCPEPFSDCLLPADSSALSTNYEALISYARDSWTLCGEPLAPTPSTTVSSPSVIAPATTP